jgi:phage shock protein A
MGRGLRMSAEIGDWLAELCSSEPVTAAEVGAALIAAMDVTDLSVLAFVTEPGAARDPREALDYAYQRLLEGLQHVRGKAAGAAADRASLELIVGERESIPDADQAELASLRRRLADARREEHDLTARSQGLQQDLDAFRTAKETAKAMYTAAEASRRIRDAVEAVAETSDEELADLDQAVRESEARAAALAEQAERTLRDARWPAAAGRAGHREPVECLRELRADTLGVDIRVLFALEPADVITLLAVLEGETAVAEHMDLAIDLAGKLLTTIRAGEWQPAEAPFAFSASAYLLARYFPADGEDVTARAAALVTATSLARLRESAGMSQADLASRAGLSEELVRSFEHAGVRLARVGEVADYAKALGRRLVLTARFDDESAAVL